MRECCWVTQNTGKENNYNTYKPCKGGELSFLSFFYFPPRETLTWGMGNEL